MLELYLFINPLGSTCYHAEQNILKLVELSKSKIKFKFVPLLNINSISSIMSSYGIDDCDLKKRNQISQVLFRSAIDYKAAMFQGTKRGRKFLMTIQQEIHENHRDYTDELVLESAEKSRLDVEMFLADRQSDLAVKCFKQDQKLAADLKVQTHPTLVVYNLAGYDCGFSIKDCDSLEALEDLLLSNDPKDFICDDARGALKKNLHTNLHPLFKQK